MTPALTALLFFLWILPLGFFIQPSQEKVACNGQRAICLCSHQTAKQSANASKISLYKGGAETAQKERGGQGGPSYPFLSTHQKGPINASLAFYHQHQSSLYSLLLVDSINHVPKA